MHCSDATAMRYLGSTSGACAAPVLQRARRMHPIRSRVAPDWLRGSLGDDPALSFAKLTVEMHETAQLFRVRAARGRGAAFGCCEFPRQGEAIWPLRGLPRSSGVVWTLAGMACLLSAAIW